MYSKPFRVLFVSTTLAYGGAETQVIRLAIRLKKRGWDVRVVSMMRPKAYVDELSADEIRERVRAAGVVGAGGAGFPAHVKLNGKAEYVIANGAECEPLLRVDQLLMQREAKRVVHGVELAMEATGAARGVIATKAHYHDAVHALEQALGGRSDITLHLMDSYYPSGDEKSIIFEVSGRVVPSGKLPLDVGCVVSNVATLVNISAA